MPPYFPSKSTVLLRGLKARHIRTKTTSRQPRRNGGAAKSLTLLSAYHSPPSRSKSWDAADSPDLSRRIWSFWHSSMNPEMRLANSTTYWMAWVIWMAHCCHSTSRGCEGKAPSLDERTQIMPPSDTQTHRHDLAILTLLWYILTSSYECVCQASCCSSSVVYWHVSKWDLIIFWAIRSGRHRTFFNYFVQSAVFMCAGHRKRAQTNVCILCTMFCSYDNEASVGFWSLSGKSLFFVAAHLPLNSTVAWICSKILISGFMLICANILRGGYSNMTQCQLAV